MDGSLPSVVRQGGRRQAGCSARLRQALHRIGPQPILLLGFLVELGWAFVGSVGLGLGVAASGAGSLQAYAWLGGAVVIAGATAGAAFLALPEEKEED